MGERDEDVLLAAAALLHAPVGLGELVLAERDPQRPDHRHRRDRDAGERLLRAGERRQVVRRHLAVEPERLLARADRVRVVPAGPLPRLHNAELKAPLAAPTSGRMDFAHASV